MNLKSRVTFLFTRGSLQPVLLPNEIVFQLKLRSHQNTNVNSHSYVGHWCTKATDTSMLARDTKTWTSLLVLVLTLCQGRAAAKPHVLTLPRSATDCLMLLQSADQAFELL